jgi:hypothetical protein
MEAFDERLAQRPDRESAECAEDHEVARADRLAGDGQQQNGDVNSSRGAFDERINTN